MENLMKNALYPLICTKRQNLIYAYEKLLLEQNNHYYNYFFNKETCNNKIKKNEKINFLKKIIKYNSSCFSSLLVFLLGTWKIDQNHRQTSTHAFVKVFGWILG